MHLSGSPQELVLSATDLSGFLACRHLTALDMAVTLGDLAKPPVYDDPLLKVLQQRGLDHERRYVDGLRAEGLGVVDLDARRKLEKISMDELVRDTLAAMRAGADVIYQGALTVGQWYGKPDVLRRVATPSGLGNWSYEIVDTKLARETRAATILQLGLYSEMLREAQGLTPERFHVVTPDVANPEHTYRVNDYAAYVRFVRDRMLDAVAKSWRVLEAEHYPDPVEFCPVCRWGQVCSERRRADDHLSLVAGIARVQRSELTAREVATMTALAELPIPLGFRPKRGSPETYVRVREQARLQVASRDRTPPLHELLDVEPQRGLCRLPEPSPGDLFLDLEGDPFAVEEGGGREYLFGLALPKGSYACRWAFTESEERAGFEWVMDVIAERAKAYPDMHVYHYAPYEPATFKRLMGRYATREKELDAMLRAGRFVDLYAVVRQGLRAGVERYSIKNLEPLYGFVRGVPLEDAHRSLRRVEYALEMRLVHEVSDEDRETVRGYNRDDCVSTLRLRDWLEAMRARLVAEGKDVPRPVLESGEASPEIDERAQRVEALRARLLDGLPDVASARSPVEQGRWILGYLLDYHRREDKATWWEYFRLRDLDADELLEEREAVAGLTFVERVEVVLSKRGKPTGSVVDRYSWPVQEMELDAGDEVKTAHDGSAFAKVAAVDRVRQTIDLRKGPKNAEVHPSAVFGFTYVPSEAMEGALLRIGERVAASKDGYGAARALLAGDPPGLARGEFLKAPDENASDFAVRIAADLSDTVLAIQGPPGAGKTHTGALMICALVRQGKRVGVTANSHKVIRNLLRKVVALAAAEKVPVRVGHKDGYGEPDADPSITEFADNGETLEGIRSGAVNVVGGTAWLWAREEFANAVDVLFVDEAGQMALANAIAVSQAATSLVLLGDPQQLEQPRKGSHPDGVGVSALEHYLRGHQTIPDTHGIFLPETWRLAPSICGFTSELFYEGRLQSRAGRERQHIAGAEELPESGLMLLELEHDGNRNTSPEEVDAVAAIVTRLTTPGVTWTNPEGVEQPVTSGDVLVVAPYNTHVSRLAEHLGGTGVRVGTVDKFQGQEAPVVIYSMATSRPEDAPRGMEFLYSLNRLNVATSRAKCLAIVVASRRLLEPECRTPRQMKLANGLCRLRELAVRPRTAALSLETWSPLTPGRPSSLQATPEPADNG